MKFKPSDIQHIADLARLELSEAELLSYGTQLSAITSYIDQLQEIGETVAPLKPVNSNVWREDKIEDWDLEENNQALKQGNLDGGLLKVKRVL